LSTPFQNRLVGTIIVAAVVIIFLPDLLDGEKQSHQDDFEAIPKAEVFSGKLTNQPFPEDKLKRKSVDPTSDEQAIDEVASNEPVQRPTPTSDEIKNKQVLAKPIVKTAEAPKPTLPEKAVAKEAWVIHLGSFKNKENVEQLLKKLKSKGYIVFTKPIKTKKGTLTKVMIGPELIKSAMVKKLPALNELTGIQGKVALFEPKK
jgi:DedD protein